MKKPFCRECGCRLTAAEHRYLLCHCNWCEVWQSAVAFDGARRPRFLFIRKLFNRAMRAALLTD